MEKVVIFKDEALIRQIEAFRQEQGGTFEDAVKELCRIALSTKESLKWGSFDR